MASDFASFLTVLAGLEANRQERLEAKAIKKQGRREAEEAAEESRRQRIEGRKFKARQKLAFLKSGVSLEGSPLLALEETQAEVNRRSERIRQAGESQFQFARTRAKIHRSRGRAALLGSFAQAAQLNAATSPGGRDYGKPGGGFVTGGVSGSSGGGMGARGGGGSASGNKSAKSGRK